MNIGQPLPDPRNKIIADLSSQIEHYLATGNRVQEVPTGVSADAPHLGTAAHKVKLKAKRDARAPEVRKHAEAGMHISGTAKAMGIHIDTVATIAKENGIKFSAPA